MSGDNKKVVLLGEDNKSQLNAYLAQGDVTVFDVAEHPYLIATANNIPTGDRGINLILAAHGGEDAMFEWRKDEGILYTNLFLALPREGSASIVIDSCFGGLVLKKEILEAAPPGALVMSLSSASNVSISPFSIRFAKETMGLTNPMDLFLEALDNFDPKEYLAHGIYTNKRDGRNHDHNPEHAIPRILGIGGNPPQVIHLDDWVAKLATIGDRLQQEGTPEQAAWRRAIERVQERSDHYNYRCDYEKGEKEHREDVCDNSDTARSMYDSGGELSEAISAMAQDIAAGKTPALTDDPVQNAEKLRLAYLLTAAYMDESGELDKLRAQAIDPNWLAGKRVDAATLAALTEGGFFPWDAGLTAQFDGKDPTHARDGKVNLTEIQAIFKQRGISATAIDRDQNGALDAKEIGAALNAPAPDTAPPTPLSIARKAVIGI